MKRIVLAGVLVLASSVLVACESTPPTATASTATAGTTATTAPAPTSPAPARTVSPVQGRLVEIAATNDGFSPKTVTAKKGETLTLRFKRTTKSDCLSSIEFPSLGVKKDLPLDEPVDVVLTADKDEITWHCWMKMLFGKVTTTS